MLKGEGALEGVSFELGGFSDAVIGPMTDLWSSFLSSVTSLVVSSAYLPSFPMYSIPVL